MLLTTGAIIGIVATGAVILFLAVIVILIIIIVVLVRRQSKTSRLEILEDIQLRCVINYYVTYPGLHSWALGTF